MTHYRENDMIPFSLKGYKFKKRLTPGGTGDTLLMYDDTIGQYFVCKKFAPKQVEFTDKLFADFIEKIKILYNSYHKNIVRIFCHFIYSQAKTGYIVMEYIDGIVKIIDFGFGKIINESKDVKTTLLLNWTENELPEEIYNEIYSIQSDIYFVGHLFEKIIKVHNIELLNKHKKKG